jgi:YqcI/YcgG family.
MNTLIRDLDPAQTPAWSAMNEATQRAFETFIGQPAFPCLGAKASQARRQLQTLLAYDIASARDDRRITRHLQAFAAQAEGTACSPASR